MFAWHLSIVVECQDLAENGMPTGDESEILNQIGDEFDEKLKADGNALFLARITWNGTRQFLYRIYDPEVANQYLSDIIESESNLRPFEYRMQGDEAWELTKYFLAHWES